MELPNLETRVSDLLVVLDAVGSERPVLVGVFESGAPNALLAATQPERVHSMVWFEPNPRFAWAPDYPWGRTPADMEAERRDIELWGTLAYGRAFIQDEATRANVMPDSAAAHMAKASRNACTPDVDGVRSREREAEAAFRVTVKAEPNCRVRKDDSRPVVCVLPHEGIEFSGRTRSLRAPRAHRTGHIHARRTGSHRECLIPA